jgi:hypothetical protein
MTTTHDRVFEPHARPTHLLVAECTEPHLTAGRSRKAREARRESGPPEDRQSQAMVTTTFRLPSPGGGTSAPVVMVPKRLSRIETRYGFEPTTFAWFPSE